MALRNKVPTYNRSIGTAGIIGIITTVIIGTAVGGVITGITIEATANGGDGLCSGLKGPQRPQHC
jgi:hypothetical protein